MLKRILLTTLFCLLAAGLGGGYFYHASRYARVRSGEEICKSIDIVIKDSLTDRLVTCRDIMGYLDGGKGIIGGKMNGIDLYAIEKGLGEKGEIRAVEAYCDNNGSVCIELLQRRAKMRFMGMCGDFYSDSTGYFFPVAKKADVPVVTGSIPLSSAAGYKGFAQNGKEKEWIAGALELGEYIEQHWYWHSQISQIDVADNGDVVLFTREGDHKFIFGDFTDIDDKFDKIATFYKVIVPQSGDKRYRTVNVKYKNQIICR